MTEDRHRGVALCMARDIPHCRGEDRGQKLVVASRHGGGRGITRTDRGLIRGLSRIAVRFMVESGGGSAHSPGTLVLLGEVTVRWVRRDHVGGSTCAVHRDASRTAPPARSTVSISIRSYTSPRRRKRLSRGGKGRSCRRKRSGSSRREADSMARGVSPHRAIVTSRHVNPSRPPSGPPRPLSGFPAGFRF